MKCEELQHGYELYVLGTPEAEERATIGAEIEAHLARGCPTCTAAVAQARALAAHLALAAPPAEPPAHLRAAILAAAAATAPCAAEPAPARMTFWKWGFAVGAVAAAALLIVSLGLLREVRSLESELRASENRTRTVRDRERDLGTRLSRYRDALQLLAAPEAREVRFGPQPRQPSGRVFLQPRGLVLVASDFPKPPEGRTYELWLIASTSPAPIPAGVFDPDAQGNALHIWQQPIQVATVKALAVSDEPPGGVPAPTGKIHLIIPVQ